MTDNASQPIRPASRRHTVIVLLCCAGFVSAAVILVRWTNQDATSDIGPPDAALDTSGDRSESVTLAAAACSRPSIWVLLIVGLNFGLYLGKARYEESVLMKYYEGYADYRDGTLGVKPLPDSGARRQTTSTENQQQHDSPSGPSVRD